MNDGNLREHVEALHAELAQARTIDSSSREALVVLLGDITRLLETSRGEQRSHDGVIPRLEELAVGFEAEHPALGTAIRQVVDALGKAGL